MSFIYDDPNLIADLVKHGLDFENKFLKRGQATPAPDPNQDVTALQQHIKGLQAQLRPAAKDPNAPAEVASQSGSDAAVNVTHFKNLGTLIAFLATNKIVIGGKRIAYAPDEGVKDPSYQLYKLEGVADTRTTKAQNVQYNYLVNKDLLVSYLTSVQAGLVQKPNPVLNTQLQAVIQTANQDLDANMSLTYKAPEKTLAPDKVVDGLSQNFTTSHPYQVGNVPLTFGDISSDTAFNAWIAKNNIYIDEKQHDFPQLNRAGLLSALLARAKNKQGSADSEDAKLTATIYAAQIPKLAQMLNVTLTGVGGQATSQQGTQSDTTGQPPAGLAELIDALPLDADQIDFGKIRRFIDLYRSTVLASDDPSRKQQASAAMDSAEKYMQGATQNTINQSVTNFSNMDGLTANDLVRWAVPPSAGEATRSRGSAKALANYLEYTVSAVSNLIKDLYNSHYNQLAAKPEWLQSIEQQVGGRSIPSGSSIAAGNLNHINIARNNLSRVGT
jgi:hypothetical protein